MSILRKDSLSISLPRKKKVCGYEIKRAPMGAFLQAIRRLQDFPAQLIDGVFPGKNLGEVFAMFKTCDGDFLMQAFARAVAVAPEYILALVSELTAIPEKDLRDDPNIGLNGLMEIITAWVEVNEIENFTRTASDLWTKALAVRKTGSSEQ